MEDRLKKSLERESLTLTSRAGENVECQTQNRSKIAGEEGRDKIYRSGQ